MPPTPKLYSTELSSVVSSTAPAAAVDIGLYFSMYIASAGAVSNAGVDGEYCSDAIVARTLFVASSGTNSTFT